ncbi:hypothetical protein DFH09DRAFT_1091722 [Mycena vulgaris]|nr:hypothetical protein DFH09DRAFT_1091722 [Mycena vulgaris]
MKLYFCHHWVDLPVAPPKLLSNEKYQSACKKGLRTFFALRRQTGYESGDPRYFHQFIARDRGHDQMGARRVAGQGPQGLMSSISDSPVLHEISVNLESDRPRTEPTTGDLRKTIKNGSKRKKKHGRPVFRKKLYLRKLQREKKIQGTCAEREVLRLSFNRYHTHVDGQQHVVLESGRARKLKDQCNPVPH